MNVPNFEELPYKSSVDALLSININSAILPSAPVLLGVEAESLPLALRFGRCHQLMTQLLTALRHSLVGMSTIRLS